eukprot:CAMPEP_0172668190 /NCGR_PEP_ID=MMETSP1074-20121228/8907_1 /TAXON_ID=2916 /ORGANISM="Ceratium fusus, Strain PA161109" /LENGTH=455 /DNA_ID=CAMNT_0013484811 /DNA_START=16 /DNA_END=1379 /DNA_ORIENTATION=-
MTNGAWCLLAFCFMTGCSAVVPRFQHALVNFTDQSLITQKRTSNASTLRVEAFRSEAISVREQAEKLATQTQRLLDLITKLRSHLPVQKKGKTGVAPLPHVPEDLVGAEAVARHALTNAHHVVQLSKALAKASPDDGDVPTIRKQIKNEMDDLAASLKKAEGQTSKAEAWMVDNGLLPKEGATNGAIEDIESSTKAPPASTTPSPASPRPRPAPRPAPQHSPARPAPQPPASPPASPGAPPPAPPGAPPPAPPPAPPHAPPPAPQPPAPTTSQAPSPATSPAAAPVPRGNKNSSSSAGSTSGASSKSTNSGSSSSNNNNSRSTSSSTSSPGGGTNAPPGLQPKATSADLEANDSPTPSHGRRSETLNERQPESADREGEDRRRPGGARSEPVGGDGVSNQGQKSSASRFHPMHHGLAVIALVPFASGLCVVSFLTRDAECHLQISDERSCLQQQQ